MIFGRKKRAQAEEAEDAGTDVEVDAAAEPTETEPTDETTTAPTETDADEPEDAGPVLDVDALDANEWRTDGPFEITELDEDAADDEDQPKIDLGSLIIAPVPGSELRLQVNEAQAIVSAMLVLPITGPVTNGAEPEVVGSSALELSAYAAPRSGGLWAELRDEIFGAATGSGGTAELVEGPFGVELRRLLPVTAPNGEQGYQPSRMWVAEGPRWLLRGIVYGQAAIEADDEDPAVVAVLDAFRAVVVRRGDEAMAPGDLLPMTMPADLQPVE